MIPRDVWEIIKQSLHGFSEDEIDCNVSRVLNCKSTLAMVWVQFVGTLPPPKILHLPSIQNKNEKTCAMIWITRNKTLPPPELIHDQLPPE